MVYQYTPNGVDLGASGWQNKIQRADFKDDKFPTLNGKANINNIKAVGGMGLLISSARTQLLDYKKKYGKFPQKILVINDVPEASAMNVMKRIDDFNSTALEENKISIKLEDFVLVPHPVTDYNELFTGNIYLGFIEFVQMIIDYSKKYEIMVCCSQGQNRSAISVLTACVGAGMTPKDGVEFVKSIDFSKPAFANDLLLYYGDMLTRSDGSLYNYVLTNFFDKPRIIYEDVDLALAEYASKLFHPNKKIRESAMLEYQKMKKIKGIYDEYNARLFS